jgi:hypothetical protein
VTVLVTGAAGVTVLVRGTGTVQVTDAGTTAFAAGKPTPTPPTCNHGEGTSDNSCLQQDTGLSNPSCTANDVRIGLLQVPEGTTCDTASLTPTPLTLTATILSGPTRYNLGIWLNTEGGSAKSDTTGANCYRDFLHPVEPTPGAVPTPGGTPTCAQDGSDGGYFNAAGSPTGDKCAHRFQFSRPLLFTCASSRFGERPLLRASRPRRTALPLPIPENRKSVAEIQ